MTVGLARFGVTMMTQEGELAGKDCPLEVRGGFVAREWLQANLDHPALRILQVGGEKYFDRYHLPGAIQVRYSDLVTSRDGVPGMVADTDVLSALFSGLGIDAGTLVVAYDPTGGLDAARLVWTLATLGHERAVVLDGGLVGWVQAGLSTGGGPVGVEPGAFVARATPEVTADWERVLAVVEKRLEAELIDTRSRNEYVGTTLRGPRGHIPGASHWEWTESLRGPQDPHLLDRELLLQRLARIGIEDREREMILYCQTAHRAAQSWLLLRHLGFLRVRLYDGSMAEWGGRGLPLVAGEFPG
ncbi:MAG: sulfurtransferase [Magnetococcales bacterium]|nr:sulfurtransferase [Magnetococcales bacterium]MBF0156182.1 sulfurtransferase [Magnetococcales bacterium]